MNEQTLGKLIHMRFTAFAESYCKQTEDPSFDDLSFHKRMSLLVDAEFDSRHNDKILRRHWYRENVHRLNIGDKECWNHNTVKYICLPELFADFELARMHSTYKKMMKHTRTLISLF